MVDGTYCNKCDSLEAELAALKERRRRDVEAAFKEGLNTGRYPFNLLDSDAVFGHRQWKESRAKQALAESEEE